MIAALSRTLSRLSLWFSAIGLTAMTLIICWQVFARYVLDAAPAWAEQSALFLMLWFILFAAAAGVREGFHIRLTLLQDSLGQARRKVLLSVCHVVVGLFGAAMAISGMQLAEATWHHLIPTIGISRGYAYFPTIAAGVLIAFFATEQLVATLRGKRIEPLWN